MGAVSEPDRWQARPLLAGLLRIGLLAVPVVASAVVVGVLGRLLPPAVAASWQGLGLLLLVAVGVAVLVERLARRLMPLAVLLRMTMLFPDRAPSRFATARAAVRGAHADDEVATESGTTTISTAVLTLLAALGTHDRRTRGHSERVRVLSDMLAEQHGLDRDARDRLRWAALLHDIGKIRVASAVLNKPARLDASELAVVQRHPQAGAELAAPLLPWLGAWGRGIAEHHEKHDGSGYPAGLSGREISEAGRLIAVVDAFETMTAARPYKVPMAVRDARTELARCAGTHFDPVVVRSFLAISLPRLLWAMGPLSVLLQLPFVGQLAGAGARTTGYAGQAAAGAANVATLATAGLAVAGTVATGALPLAQASADGTLDRSTTIAAAPTPRRALPALPAPRVGPDAAPPTVRTAGPTVADRIGPALTVPAPARPSVEAPVAIVGPQAQPQPAGPRPVVPVLRPQPPAPPAVPVFFATVQPAVPGPGPFLPAPAPPGPAVPESGPVLPGPVLPGPVLPAPVLPRPVLPGPALPGPALPAPVLPGPVLPPVGAPGFIGPLPPVPALPDLPGPGGLAPRLPPSVYPLPIMRLPSLPPPRVPAPLVSPPLVPLPISTAVPTAPGVPPAPQVPAPPTLPPGPTLPAPPTLPLPPTLPAPPTVPQRPTLPVPPALPLPPTLPPVPALPAPPVLPPPHPWPPARPSPLEVDLARNPTAEVDSDAPPAYRSVVS